jgi:hypothetical protein
MYHRPYSGFLLQDFQLLLLPLLKEQGSMRKKVSSAFIKKALSHSLTISSFICGYENV